MSEKSKNSEKASNKEKNANEKAASEVEEIKKTPAEVAAADDAASNTAGDAVSSAAGDAASDTKEPDIAAGSKSDSDKGETDGSSPHDSENAEAGDMIKAENDLPEKTGDNASGDVSGDDSASDGKSVKAKKKSWKNRSIPERILSSIPAALIFVLVIIAEYQTEIGEIYPMEMYLSIALAAVTFVIGIFCVRLGKVWGWVLFALAPFAVFLLTEFFTHNPFVDIYSKSSSELFYINLILYYGAALLILAVTGSVRASVVITSVIPMLYGIANYYTLEFRGNPLFPWDFASAGIAADVVGNYKFEVEWHVCFIVCAFLAIIQLGSLTNVHIKLKLWWVRAPIAVISAAAIVMSGAYVQSDKGVSELRMYPYLFTPKTVYNRNGVAVTFVYTLQYSTIKKPQNYSPARVSSLLDDYESEDVVQGKRYPNVIVIMNEAFSDLRTASDYEAVKPVTPRIDALDEDTVKGTMHVSVKGGNTPNTEFEFLTGLSMAHFVPGSIPYQQYMEGDTPSFAGQLSDLGYKTVGMHPYGATGWNRNNVYKWFGFDETYFSSDFKGYDKIRGYYSDAATYKKIIELYEAKDTDQPMFVFDVTMQNHGGYTGNDKYTNFKPETFVSGVSEKGVTNTYFTLINKSDEAFGELLDYFDDKDEPTVILMFGDHQPNDNVVSPLWKLEGRKVETGSIDEQLRRYTVPFVMWANFDIEEESGVEISANYLSSLLCEKAGIPRTAAQMYLSELSKDYPVICAGHYMNDAGDYFDAVAMSNEAGLVDYSMLSYNLISDRKNMLTEFFTLK